MATHEELHSYLKQAVLELEKTRQRLREIEARGREPIAIVGMACRYPGGLNSPAELWRAVCEKRDLVSGLPSDRGWEIDEVNELDSASGARFGGFIADVSMFDADFFGIGACEAAVMDPHQRVVLESAWEAFERAGIDPATVRGTDTGVFLGMTSNMSTTQNVCVATEDMTSWAASMVAGRVSYFFGFDGPAITLDTACSSSLVAIHRAIRSLRSGECPLAIAGGVTVMTQQGFVGLVGKKPAAAGRCKSFAASADRPGWGEGVGVLLLERLSDAVENQHPVLAVIRGSAVNHDGPTNGPEAPNRLAQQRVIQRALQDADLSAAQVDVVEAHGTGIPVGDATEVEALIETYGRNRPDGRPLWLGSLKSNMGHTLAAAGVGGVIKMVEALRHRVIPATLHAEEPTPFVDWSSGGVQLAADAHPWLPGEGARRAGVSGFGLSGVNAHLILEEAGAERSARAEATGPSTTTGAGALAWVITAKSAEALPMQGARLLEHLEQDPDFRPIDIAYSLATSRTTFNHRAVVVGSERDELLGGLRSLAADATSSAVVRSAAPDATKTAVLFSGESAQLVGVGQQLYARSPIYAAAFDEVCSHFDEQIGTPLRDAISGAAGPGAPRLLDQPGYAQPALFAVQVALFRLAQSWGLRPDYVIGHSLGEISAAYVAGLWSLEDACHLVAERARLVQMLPAEGAMLCVEASQGDVSPYLREFAGCALAAINGPLAVTISGEERSLNTLSEKLEANGMRTNWSRVGRALHSSHMNPLIPELMQAVRKLSYRVPTIQVISGFTGRIADADVLTTPEYWVDQLTKPVRFMEALRWARVQGEVSNFLEIGPGAELVAYAEANFAADEMAGEPVCAATLLKPGIEENESFIRGLATAFVRGASIDWAAGSLASDARRVELPTYAFQRKRHWPTTGSAGYGGVSISPRGVSQSTEPPRTETERLLAEAIEHLLDIPRVGRADRFVALGGDSVTAMQLAARVRAAGMPLTPQLIFDHPTVQQLAEALDRVMAAGEDEGDAVCDGSNDARGEAMSMSGLSAEQLAALPGVLAKIDAAVLL
ncbi:Beta-ketoacyl-acyl-carrier-protein synthase I [Mycobacterium basiliense]|uniref:Beta-ketoacyl-acyl-carrier-protein synthase I n=1 Tax=Mycobacterium basiliense TaxID=2094119 RepID=A0A447GAP0_9MYCO|nr:type I polyketide synthase [Mycobacterium basiliense]VDM87528.1 Beta-ketoacyl-acyl-carrier-protein synthase I [Mycobacterium basiliense]